MLNFSEGNRSRRLQVCALAFMLLTAGCNTDRTVTGSFPRDYAERHPIRLTEGEHSIQLLVGSGHGALTAEQRAQVAAMAGAWQREGTCYLVIHGPAGTPHERAASRAVHEVKSLFQAYGVPSSAILARSYRPPNRENFGSVRIAYTRVVATAGPCGEWPEDLGASIAPSLQVTAPSIDNRPYWNFGCASQRNLAAAVANPEDLVQPRAETPAYASRRQQVLDKYRQGQDPSSTYTKTTDAKVSDVK